MMHQMTQDPLFGLTLTILAYVLASKCHNKWPHPLTNPLLLATVGLIVFLAVTHISYQDYYIGASYINTMIIPATVSLGLVLFESLALLKRHWQAILLGITVGTLVNTLLTAILAKAFGMSYFLSVSLFPKSVTAAMAIGLSEKMQGLATVTLVVVVSTGILTSAIGPSFLRLLGIKDKVAVGVALGGTGHAVGTSAALKIGPVEGAIAGLSIGLTGLAYVVVSPLVAALILG